MFKNLTGLIIIFNLLGCSNSEQANIINRLQAENDSLKIILSEIDNKYVFDSIAFRDIYHPENSYRINSDFNIELLVVEYSPNKSYFIRYDSIVDGKKINPDTLKLSNGGFKLNTRLNQKENPIWIEMNIENKYGKSQHGQLYDNIKTKD